MDETKIVGVSTPDIVRRETVAGTNAVFTNATPGVAAGPIDPQQSGFNNTTNVDARQTINAITGIPYSKKKISARNYDLSNARATTKEELNGTLLWVAFASDPDATIDVIFDDLSNDPITFKEGSYISGVPFEKFWVTNAAQAGETIQLIIMTDRPLDRVDFR